MSNWYENGTLVSACVAGEQIGVGDEVRIIADYLGEDMTIEGVVEKLVSDNMGMLLHIRYNSQLITVDAINAKFVTMIDRHFHLAANAV